MDKKLALIGFGEAGSSFAAAARWGALAQAYDIKTGCDSSREGMQAAYRRAGVVECATLHSAVDGAQIILSMVTADQALAAASDAANFLGRDALYLDMNSVAPQTKQAAAQCINQAGGHYIDVAIMSPVNPARMAVPLLVSARHAEDAVAALSALGFSNVRVVGSEVGRASTIKMLRSVMYKGVEALTAECLMACEKAGVTDEVMDSFGNDWSSGADYRLDRVMVHGLRRAAETQEVVSTLERLGIEPLMTRGTVERQRQLGLIGIDVPPPTLGAKLERLVQ